MARLFDLLGDLTPIPGYRRILVVSRHDLPDVVMAVADREGLDVETSAALDVGEAYTWQKPDR